jgi:hypothetical protein
MKPLARWTIGNTTKDGWDCLKMSIESFVRYYDVDVEICFNCDVLNLPTISAKFRLFDQRSCRPDGWPEAKGVAWKLYPPRLNINRHEIQIDNDIVLNDRIEEIDRFFISDCTLLLEGNSRTYGRFEKHVPVGYQINSGIFGMPPGFDLANYIDFLVGVEWEKNALGEHDKNETFDEQGIVAFALLSYKTFVIIPQSKITNCEHKLVDGQGHHFIGLNRRNFHWPYRLYKCRNHKLYL